MRTNKIKQLWREGNIATIGWISTGDTYTAETMANMGYDALVIDMQHGMGITADKAIHCIQVISTTDTTPIVRVPWNAPEHIQYTLDAGAYGIIIPMVNNYEEAKRAVGACLYPPLGYRSMAPNRVLYYSGNDYPDKSNEEIITLIMVETVEAINNLEEMSKVPGLDGFYVGPNDLAVSLGITPGIDALQNSKHIEACQRVLDVSQKTGLIPCHHGPGPKEAARRFREGFKMCQIGNDIDLIKKGSISALEELAIMMATQK
jgi:4-hydroxy-2-oxoheptanedioate aldolase